MTDNTEFYSMTLLNGTGDITLTWENNEDAEIKAMIQAKIDSGYCFFIFEPRVSFLKVLGKKRKTIRDVAEIKGREVVMKTNDNTNAGTILKDTFKIGDSGSDKLFKLGKVGIATVPESDYGSVRKTKDANEVMKQHTVVTAPIAAG